MLRNNKGVTLVELLIVIVILGIIAAIAVPAVGNIVDNARDDAFIADATTIRNAASTFCQTATRSQRDDYCDTSDGAENDEIVQEQLEDFIEGLDADYSYFVVRQPGGSYHVYLYDGGSRWVSGDPTDEGLDRGDIFSSTEDDDFPDEQWNDGDWAVYNSTSE